MTAWFADVWRSLRGGLSSPDDPGTGARSDGARLKQDQLLLFQVLEAVPAGIFILDATGKPVYANQRAQQLLGKGIAQAEGPDQLAQTYQAYRAGTSEPYPAARMPVVRALSGESSMIADMEIHQPDRIVPLHRYPGSRHKGLVHTWGGHGDHLYRN